MAEVFQKKSLPPKAKGFADILAWGKGEPTTTTEKITRCAVGSLLYVCDRKGTTKRQTIKKNVINMKTRLLNDILSVVSDVCEIPADLILSYTKRNDVVDARCLFVHFVIRKYGFQTSTLAAFLNRKRICTINDCLRNHDLFLSQSVSYRLMCNEIDRKLSTIYPAS